MTSGLFGRDLPENGWIDFKSAVKRLIDWYDLRERDSSLTIGWLDVHARCTDG